MYLHLAGHNRALAACRAGVSRATFFNYLRRYKIKAPRCNEKITREDAELIRDLAGTGMRQADIAEKFDCDRSTVARVASYARR